MEMEAICDILIFPRTILGKGKRTSENVVELLVLRFHVGQPILSCNLAPTVFLVSMCQLAYSCC